MNQYHYLEIEFGTPEYDQAISLRDKILRKPLKLEFSEDQIAEEYNQIHFGCFDHHYNLLACLSYQVKEGGTLKMRQVAVDDSLQNKGIGSAVVKFTEQWAKYKNYKKIILHARDTAVTFYLKLHYIQNGKPFTEVGILHYAMEKIL